jgi:hypothetical protein
MPVAGIFIYTFFFPTIYFSTFHSFELATCSCVSPPRNAYKKNKA